MLDSVRKQQRRGVYLMFLSATRRPSRTHEVEGTHAHTPTATTTNKPLEQLPNTGPLTAEQLDLLTEENGGQPFSAWPVRWNPGWQRSTISGKFM